jgi:hypothetical protein
MEHDMSVESDEAAAVFLHLFRGFKTVSKMYKGGAIWFWSDQSPQSLEPNGLEVVQKPAKAEAMLLSMLQIHLTSNLDRQAGGRIYKHLTSSYDYPSSRSFLAQSL